jgi:hypothetical protein
MYSAHDDGVLSPPGFPIRKSPGQSLFSGLPKLIAAYHVLHRLPMPRHPPYALNSLTIKKSSTLCDRFFYLMLVVTCRLKASNCSCIVSSLMQLSKIKKTGSEFYVPRSKLKTSSLQPRTLSIERRTECLVEVNGIEPMTSCVQGRRSPN